MLVKLVNHLQNQIRRSPFTATGRLLTIACLFCFFAIVDFALARLLSHVIWLLIIGFSTGFLFRPKLRVQLRCLQVAFNGERFELQVIITNLGRFGAYDLQLDLELPSGWQSDEPVKFVGSIAPGHCVTIPYRLTPTQRGIFEIQRFTVASLFPLSLFRFLVSHTFEQRVFVAPSYTEQKEVIGDIVDQIAINESAGDTQKNSLLEYIGSREFRPGVPVRRWDFSSWARLGIPSVREFVEGSNTLVVLVVDTTGRTKAVDHTLETTLSTTTGILMGCAHLMQPTMLVTVAKEVEFGAILTGVEQCAESLKRLASVEGDRVKIDWLKVWDTMLLEIPPNATLVAVFSDPDAYVHLQHQVDTLRRIVPCLVPVTGARAAATTMDLSA